MQTVLGANGAIGVCLARNLTQFTERIRLVSRDPRKVNPSDELMVADLTKPEETLWAVEGTSVAYLTVGLRYHTGIWRKAWPVIMKNVVEACRRHGARLVFFDNVYAYGLVRGWMAEETPVHPASRKGEVRARIAEMLMREVIKGNLRAQIVRSADFYGPGAPTSVVNLLVFDNLRRGKPARWIGNDKVRHSFTYVPDAARATALLGNTEAAYNQVWHLPTDRNALTGKQFIELAAAAFRVEPKYRVLKKWAMRLLGLFKTTARESVEMMYQNEFDYLFDSAKFERAFGFQPTTYEQGIRETVWAIKDVWA